MAVMSGEMVVLPFTRDCVSSSVLRALGGALLSWKFVLATMTVGVFKVESVASMGRGTYTVSYVRRLAGPTLSVGDKDPIRSMLKVEVSVWSVPDRACDPHEFGVARGADAATGNQCGGVTGKTKIG